MIYGNKTIVRNGLLLHLDAANPKSYVSGSFGWYDLGSLRSVSTLVNSPVFVNDSGGAISFDGDNDYAIGHGVSLTNAATFNVWFKTASTGTNKYLFSVPFVSTCCNGMDITFINATAIGGYVVTLNSSAALSYTTTYSDNRWHMITTTYDGTNARLYYDYQLVHTVALTGNIKLTSDGEYNVGRFGTGGSYAVARISTCQIYNRALSASEIFQNYNSFQNRFNIR